MLHVQVVWVQVENSVESAVVSLIEQMELVSQQIQIINDILKQLNARVEVLESGKPTWMK